MRRVRGPGAVPPVGRPRAAEPDRAAAAARPPADVPGSEAPSAPGGPAAAPSVPWGRRAPWAAWARARRGGGPAGGRSRAGAWAAALALLLAAAEAPAATILFDARWREGGWWGPLGADPWRRSGDRLSVATRGAEGPIWRAMPPTLWDARRASWRWGVSLTGPAGRERPAATLAIRFVFAPTEVARRLGDASPRRAARHPRARVLVYVWGGAGRPGAVTLSSDGRTAIVTARQGGTGAASEAVDLAADHARAFGVEPGALVALGVSADAAGAGGPIEAAVAELTLN